MSAFDTAKRFFAACETPLGWAGCAEYVEPGAPFSAQSEPLTDVRTVEAYCEWMHGFGTVTAPGARYELHTCSFDEANNTATFFATYHATHTGDAGPVPATGKTTASEYVYIIKMSDTGRVAAMTKVWNAPWAMRELGWVD